MGMTSDFWIAGGYGARVSGVACWAWVLFAGAECGGAERRGCGGGEGRGEGRAEESGGRNGWMWCGYIEGFNCWAYGE